MLAAIQHTLPKISIVTPSFNQGQFLEECIDSILSQDYPNLEYIIMDGGSSDNSVEIIRKYERYLTYWQSQPDGGQYAAIQAGFERSTGEIMAWLNSDDKYHGNALFTVAYLFACNSEIDWLVGRSTWWGKEGELTGIMDYLPSHNRQQFLDKRFDKTWVQQESTFWRRSLWERSGGCLKTELDFAGDLELWVRFFRHADLYTVNALLGGYRGHGDQKAAHSMDKYMVEANAVVDEEIELMSNELSPQLRAAPPHIEIDYIGIRDFYNEMLPPGKRPNLSPHQSYAFLQKERDSLDILASRLRVKLEELSRGHITLYEFTNSLTWRMTAPLRKLVDLLRRR